MDNGKLLQSIGFSETESKLYLASLELGPGSIIQLAKRTGLSRQMIYLLVESLMQKGTMKEITMNGKHLFQAMSPDVLNDRVANISSLIKEAVPLLKSKEATNASLPMLSVYENPISMREWYRRFMKEAKKDDELLIWATNKTWYSVDPGFLQEFIKFKKRRGINDSIIAPDTKESRLFAKESGQSLRNYRFVNKWWMTNAEKWIWRNTVSFLTISENATNLIVIESEQLAAIEKFNFKKIWENLCV
jgi:sugar-specific transcriptional regulator TrmB